MPIKSWIMSLYNDVEQKSSEEGSLSSLFSCELLMAFKGLSCLASGTSVNHLSSSRTRSHTLWSDCSNLSTALLIVVDTKGGSVWWSTSEVLVYWHQNWIRHSLSKYAVTHSNQLWKIHLWSLWSIFFRVGQNRNKLCIQAKHPYTETQRTFFFSV